MEENEEVEEEFNKMKIHLYGDEILIDSEFGDIKTVTSFSSLLSGKGFCMARLNIYLWLDKW